MLEFRIWPFQSLPPSPPGCEALFYRRSACPHQALIPLKKKWFAQSSLSGLKRVEQIELLARSGCKSPFIGLESLCKENLKGVQKFQNDPAEYRDIIDVLHRHGIAICGSFVFGFEDDPSVFKKTVSFSIGTKLFSAVFMILTPHPFEDDPPRPFERDGRRPGRPFIPCPPSGNGFNGIILQP